MQDILFRVAMSIIVVKITTPQRGIILVKNKNALYLWEDSISLFDYIENKKFLAYTRFLGHHNNSEEKYW